MLSPSNARTSSSLNDLTTVSTTPAACRANEK